MLASALTLNGCGSSSAGSAAVSAPAKTPSFQVASETTRSSEPSGGSSDGQTCEQARAGYVEEVTVGATGQQDLSANDFAAVLNQGTYLEPCAVPASSKLRICAAVQNGRAVGVTVAAEPLNPEVEICVAKQVRSLPFPAHVKMDVVNVQF